jgi:DNA-binding winged helix-turn-helix (wHTH) protein/TolB-like protein
MLNKYWRNGGKVLALPERKYTAEKTNYAFGGFRLYPSEHLLLKGSDPVPLTPKAFELLVALIGNHGHLLTREALMQKLWPDSFVEETNLTVNISLLRKTLGEMPGGRNWIATVPKSGYRFDGLVTVHAETNIALAPAGPVSVSAAKEIGLPVAPAENSQPQAGPPHRKLFSGFKLSRRRLVIPATAMLVFSLCLWIGFRVYALRHPTELASIHTIAILPLQSNSASADDQYLGIGLTDALITRLGRLSQIVVRPIGAVRRIGKVADPVALGKQLNVQALLGGTVQRAGDHIRVAVHLQRVADGNVVWTDSFDEQNSSDFQIEDSISQRLAKALTLQLSHDQQRQLATPNTPNSHAYELYIQGRYYWNKRTVDSMQKSIDLFRQATMLDPNYAAAWSGLADAWILAGSYGSSFLAPGVAMPRAKQAAERALALDDSSAEAHTSLAYIHLMWDWDFAAAEQEFKRALQISPGYVNAHHWYSHELIALGRISESHEQSESALSLDPTDVVINEHMAWHHLMAREYVRSISQAYKAVELDPDFVQARRVLGLGLLYSAPEKEACAEFEKGVELSHNDPVARAYLARCYAQTHRESDARKMVADLERTSTERFIPAVEIAAIYASLHDSTSALSWLDKACDEHDGSLIYLNADRVWDSLRSNPGFRSELNRVNLPATSE